MKCVFLAVATVLLPAAIFAQIRSATISGKVSDPTNAAVPNAAVTVIAKDTNVETPTVTNRVGEFTVPYLAAGEYSIRVASPGFVTAQVSHVIVGTADTVTADIKLELGQVAQAVEVEGLATTLQTESATKQSSVDQRVIEAIPNINQNPFQYAAMQPGVTSRAALNDSQTPASFGVGVAARRAFSAISIGGGLPFNNDIQLDGVSIQGAGWNEATVLPNPDSIQEVRTMVNNYSAEYGRGQGVISVVGKSGTNSFHGSVFDRLRNEALNANSFANNSRGLSRNPLKVNSYGATAGGPVRKNVAFFFVSYQGLKTKQGVNDFATVPDAAERIGDFSHTVVNVNGQPRPVQIFDPYSAKLTGTNVYTRTAVPNAIIPLSQRDPFALKAMSYYPLPNRTPDDAYEANNFLLRGAQDISRNSVNSRVDFHQGRNSYYATMGVSQGTITQPPGFGPDSYPFSSVGALSTSDKNPYVAIGDTIVLSNSLVLDIRYGIARLNTEILSGHLDRPFDYSQFGISPELQAINPYPQGPPNITVGGRYTALSTGSPGNLNQDQHQTNHHIVGNVTKTAGHWTFKAGAEYRAYLSNLFSIKGTVSLGNTLPTVGDATMPATLVTARSDLGR